MPSYLYECPRCHRQQEMEQRISERVAPLCTCTEGDPVEMTTVIQPTSFVLKGKGWSKDGYS